MLKKLILSLVIVFSATALFAEGNATKSSDTNATANSSSSLDVAFKLLNEMKIKDVYNNAVENSTLRLVNANPAFKSIEGKIRDFYKKYIGWDSVKDDLAKLYAKYYTKSELEDITNFYKTKTGKKVLATMGKLSYETQLITQKRLKPHLEDLKKILDDAVKKAQEAKDKKDSNSTKESKK